MLMVRSRFALLCCAAAAALVTPVRAADLDSDEAEAAEVRGLRDNPARRAEALKLMWGQRTAEEQAHVLREAGLEARRHGIGDWKPRSAQAVAGSVWINLGPTSAAFESNGVSYSEIDSGRIRQIVPHPTDPNVVYLATAGGGVWKSFDARALITSTTGPHWTPITEGIGSLSIGALAMDPLSPETLVLGLGDPFDVHTPGLVTSDDGGAHWSLPVNLTANYPGGLQGQIAQSVRAMAFDDTGGHEVFAATDVGLFRGPTGGIGGGWTVVDLSPNHSTQECWSVAFVGQGVWMAACLSNGNGKLYRSTDGGIGWSEISLPDENSAKIPGRYRMTIAAAAGDRAITGSARVYVLAEGVNIAHRYDTPPGSDHSDQKDVYKSIDGGAHFSSLHMYDEAAEPFGTAVTKPRNPNSDQPDCDVLHDQAWYNQAIQVDPRNHDVVFVGGNLSLIRTRDGGTTWDVITNWLPRSPLIANQYNLPYVHADFHAMAVSFAGDPLVPARLYVGTDGGLFASDDLPLAQYCPHPTYGYIYCSAFTGPPGYVGTTVPEGSAVTHMPSPTFTSRLNRGITTHLAYSVTADERDSANLAVMGGLQDNGTRLRALTGGDTLPTVFNQVIGGDGFGVAMGRSVDTPTSATCYNQSGSLLIGTVYTMIYRSYDCGATFFSAVKGIDNCPKNPGPYSPGGNPCQMDPGTNFYMKMATDFSDTAGKTFLTLVNGGYLPGDVYRTQDSAASWQKIDGTITLSGGGTATRFPQQLVYIGAHPTKPLSYLTVSPEHVYATLDGGATWTESAVPQRTSLSSAAFDPGDPTRRTLWASSKSAYLGGPAHVFVSTDLGATWTAKGGSGAGALTDVPANAVKVDPNDSHTIYLGTEIGLYKSSDSGASWARYGTGLPLVSVTEISVTLDSTAIRISTFGRGFWELNPRVDIPGGAFGNGDMDRNQVIDAYDLVLQAAELWASPRDADYDSAGNLTGTSNQIDLGDVGALVAKLGGRP